MRRLFIFLIMCMLWPVLAGAQYINTDSIMVLPGYELPLHICEFDTISLTTELFAGAYNPVFAGEIETGILLANFTIPSQGKVISRFGPRGGRMHTGTDIKMNHGDTVYAAFDGIVTKARHYYGYGNLVVIDHGKNLETCYGHLSAFLVGNGDHVKKGEPLGLAGRTGRATTNHLHFEIRENDRPYNPELVFDFENNSVKNGVQETEKLAHLHKESKSRVTASGSGAPQVYKVQPGDSLWKISRRFRTSINTLCMLNNLTEKSVLQVGQMLQMN